jgi:hypothetical protein
MLLAIQVYRLLDLMDDVIDGRMLEKSQGVQGEMLRWMGICDVE